MQRLLVGGLEGPQGAQQEGGGQGVKPFVEVGKLR